MRHVELASGDRMPAIGLGTWKMDDGVGFDAVRNAIRLGYRHIDCAWIYNNEPDVGRAIRDCIDSGTVTRDQLWITSKLWNDRHHPEHVADAAKEALEKLQLDYLDLYIIHWPVAHQYNIPRPENGGQFVSLDELPLTETWQAMLECVEAGLCRNAGVSNFSQRKIEQLIESTNVAPACNQVESHPFLQQNSLLEFCTANRIAFTAYSPLGSGDRPVEMKRDDEPDLFANATLLDLSAKHEVEPAQLMLAWAICRGTIAIPKSANVKRQEQNLAAASIRLDEEDMNSMALLDRHHRFVDGTFWEVDGGPYTVSALWDE